MKEKERQLGETYRQKEEADRLRWEIDRLNQQCAERSTEYENLKNEFQELAQTMTDENTLQEDLDAVDLAMEVINRLSAGKRTGWVRNCREKRPQYCPESPRENMHPSTFQMICRWGSVRRRHMYLRNS